VIFALWKKKVRLRIRVRRNNKGAYVASVPLRSVEKMSRKCHRSWYLEDGWLVLVSN
jgi:hypothetical protein